MKTHIKKTIALLLVLMLGVTILSGCGGGVSGKYVLVSASNGYETLNEDQARKEFGEMYIEFISGDKCEAMLYGELFELPFKVDGNIVTISYFKIAGTENNGKGKIDGKKIIFEFDVLDNGLKGFMIYEKK